MHTRHDADAGTIERGIAEVERDVRRSVELRPEPL
jgi:hypothetical protein